jgi:hypothetical protein
VDQDLKEYLDNKFAVMDGKVAATAKLVEDTSASLQREIGTLQDSLQGIQRRLDRQAGLIQTGARQITRTIEWSEKVDVALEDLLQRVQRLENKATEN